MMKGIRTLALAALLSLVAVVQSNAAADTPEARQKAAERLFDLPVYRLLATRQLYEAIDQWPEANRRDATAALKDPKVVSALKAAIVKSMVSTFTVQELEFVGRVMAAPEARGVLEKSDDFRAVLLREMLTAGLTDPQLGRILLPR
ncbi:MAG TPA: hypothetical protein VFA81_00570 [Burkholderiales bacterium]|nr:hypothetical protein [Burkholderiales bacterium]